MSKPLIYRIVVILMLFISGPTSVIASLAAGGVTTLSGSSNISRTDSSSITLRWSMDSFGSAPGSRISSQTGRFLDGAGNVIGVNNKLLVKTITPLPSLRTTVTITETLRIPKSVLYTANQMGLTQITYERSFTDCPATTCNTLTPDPNIIFNLTSSSGAAFSVTNYKLRFGNDQVSTIINQGDKIKAVAYINVTRTGSIRGVWEVATPSSTAGIPAFRTLRTVQRQLTSFASNPIESPVLPHNATGIHLIRFRFLEPKLAGEIPTLQYMINATRKPVIGIPLLQPQNATVFSEQSVFSWQPIIGVSAYKLEIIEPPVSITDRQQAVDDYVAVTGMMLKSADTQTQLNKNVIQKLQPGRLYWWHIIGLDEKGQVVGQSSWRSIQVK